MTAPAPVLPTIAPEVVVEELTEDDLGKAHLVCHCAVTQLIFHSKFRTLCGKLVAPPANLGSPGDAARCGVCESANEFACPSCACPGGRRWHRLS